MATITARQFNQDVSAAKRAALEGPVIVTDRGQPAYVLLTFDEYRHRLGRSGADLVERLAMPEDDYVDDDTFQPARFHLDAAEL